MRPESARTREQGKQAQPQSGRKCLSLDPAFPPAHGASSVSSAPPSQASCPHRPPPRRAGSALLSRIRRHDSFQCEAFLNPHLWTPLHLHSIAQNLARVISVSGSHAEKTWSQTPHYTLQGTSGQVPSMCEQTLGRK